MTPPIDIRADHLRTVQDVLQRHLPAGVKVWVFGSRATWETKDSSDLDLALEGDGEIPPRSLSALEAAFEDSDLPFAVDIVDVNRIDERFRQILTGQRVLLPEHSGSQANAVRRVSLQNLCTEIVDCPHSTPTWTRDGVVVLRSKNIRNGRLDLSQPSYTSETDYAQRTKRATPLAGDLVITREAPMGEVCMIPSGLRCCLGQRMVLLRPRRDTTDPRYLLYALQSKSVQQEIRLHEGTGSTVSNLRISLLEDLQIPSHPLSAQRAIAHVLGALDDKIELNRRMNVTLEEMARALFRSWFVDFDPVRAKMEGRDALLPAPLVDLFPKRLVDSDVGEIPSGWFVGTLGDVASLNPESWSNHSAPDHILYVDLANTKWGYIDDVPMYAWETAPSRGRRVLRQGDTIVGTVRPGNGSFALIDSDGLTGSTAFAVLRPTNSADREIVWCAATSRDAIDRLAHLADGGAYPAVSPKAVLDTRVTLPDARTRRAFSALTSPLLNRIQGNQREARLVASLRDGLLPRLVSGDLRARYAEPEIQ